MIHLQTTDGIHFDIYRGDGLVIRAEYGPHGLWYINPTRPLGELFSAAEQRHISQQAYLLSDPRLYPERVLTRGCLLVEMGVTP